MTREHRLITHVVVLAMLLLSLVLAAPVRAADGIASWWHGDVAAVPNCVWPWNDCAAIAITSHATGIRIVVTPAMWCQCYRGTADARLVDLTRRQVRALGLDPGDGLYAVTVERVDRTSGLPDTAVTP